MTFLLYLFFFLSLCCYSTVCHFIKISRTFQLEWYSFFSHLFRSLKQFSNAGKISSALPQRTPVLEGKKIVRFSEISTIAVANFKNELKSNFTHVLVFGREWKARHGAAVRGGKSGEKWYIGFCKTRSTQRRRWVLSSLQSNLRFRLPESGTPYILKDMSFLVKLVNGLFPLNEIHYRW